MEEEQMYQKMNHLLSRFGKNTWREGQRELIQWAVDGHSCLGVLPTGYGKSLCYQIASQLTAGLTLVISPLIALMRDQVLSLDELGIAAARYDSTLSEDEKNAIINRIERAELSLLYLAPESLEQPSLLSLLDRVQLGLLVIDEAHCVSEWGHSFRPDYLQLAEFARVHHFHALMAMTATAPQKVQQDLQHYFHIKPEHSYSLPPYRANITRLVAWSEQKDADLAHFLSSPEHLPTIVYCRTRQSTDELSYLLQQQGLHAIAYHAGQSAQQREQIQDKFMQGEVDILVATIAFGMGVDQANIRSVVHYHAPSTPEAYVQESGRAGRDGKPATSLVLMNHDDDREIRNRIAASQPESQALLRCTRWLLPEITRLISLWELTTQCDLNDDVPERALRLMSGSITKRATLYKHYKLRPLYPIETILDGRSDEECHRLRWLNDHRDGSLDELVDAWDCTYEEAFTQLQECEAAQEWSLKLRQQAWLIQRDNDHIQPREAAQQLDTYYEQQKEQALMRWEQMRTILIQPHGNCINQALDLYFSPRTHAERASCTHCQTCHDQAALHIPAPRLNPAPSYCEADIPSYLTEVQRRRFLLGLSSPALIRKRLYSHKLYGCCRHLSWDCL